MKYIILFIAVLLGFSNLSGQTSQIDSLLSATELMEKSTQKIDNYNEISWSLRSSDYEKAVKISQTAYALSEELNYTAGKALAQKNLGGIYYLKGDYGKALEYYNSSLILFESIGDKEGQAAILRNLGSVYHQQGYYDKALESYFKSITIREALGDKNGIAALNNAIGTVYTEQGRAHREDALEYYGRGLKLFEELKDKAGVAKSYYLMGVLFLKIYNFTAEKKDTADQNKALMYYEKFLKTSRELDDKRSIAQALDAIAALYLETNKTQKAKILLDESIAISKEIDYQFGLASSYSKLGIYYEKMNNSTQAISFNLKALKIANDIRVPLLEKNIHAELCDNYEKVGNIALAFDHYKKAMSLRDSLSNEAKNQEIARLGFQRELDKTIREKEMEQQKTEIENKARQKRDDLFKIFLAFALLLVTGIAVIVLRSNRHQQRANMMLQQKNAEILQQSEEINAQKEQIEMQHALVVEQRDEISVKNKHITDSILYARRIQEALLPTEEYINRNFGENFIIYKPRDIVSGDFYWAAKRGDVSIISVVDCTGHGVPGAFMSMLGISFLNEIINKMNPPEITAGKILTQLRIFVKRALKQTGKDNEQKDGMDMALLVIDFKNYKAQYAGANNPLIHIRKGEIFHYKPDKMPIGIYLQEKEDFTNHELELQKGDALYIFSDGFQDQFGGPVNRKYMIKGLKNLLSETFDKSTKNQKEIIENRLQQWMTTGGNKYEQMDDICLIGLKI